MTIVLMKYPFIKMHGLGNDFVILDHRDEDFHLSPEKIQKITHRSLGIGCDQLIVLEQAKNPKADVFMRIYNPDGLEAGACGNGTRCLGALLADEFKRPTCVIETISGLLTTTKRADNLIEVNMGEPRLQWQDIPLKENCDTLHLPVKKGVLADPVAVSMGNPHMIFFVRDVMGIDIHNLGKQLTKHKLFPEKTNVEFVEVINRHTLRVRIYERGAGVTMACGTGASASVVAAQRRGLIDNQATVILDGGKLDISYEKTVMITGPVGYTFSGIFDETLFEIPCQSQNTKNSPLLKATQ